MPQHKLAKALETAGRRQITLHRVPESKGKEGPYAYQADLILPLDTIPFLQKVQPGDEIILAVYGTVKAVHSSLWEGKKPQGTVVIQVHETAKI